jgi:hypothetical protein
MSSGRTTGRTVVDFILVIDPRRGGFCNIIIIITIVIITEVPTISNVAVVEF